MDRVSAKIRLIRMLLRGFVRGISGARLGSGVTIVRKFGGLEAGSSVIGDGVKIAIVGNDHCLARLSIGSNTSIGDRTIINVTQNVVIGKNTQISWDCQILDTDFHEIRYADGTQTRKSASISIGDHVLIGTGVVILKGVTIGDNCVIGAGSVVTKDVPNGWLAAGNPARLLREVETWY